MLALYISHILLTSYAFALLEHKSYGEYRNSLEQDSLVEDSYLFFEQPRDHFDLSDKNKFKQMYYVDDFSYKPGGPVFLYLTGEWSLHKPFSSLELDLAKRYNGMVVGLEHRYYGNGNNSRPVPDFSVPNMKWLSSEQALADTANFIKNVDIPKLGNNSKWIVIGASYAGNLAAWMRLKYPELVYAAHSSSAPVLAQLDFQRYGHTAIKGLVNLQHGSQVCADNWVKVVTYFDDLVAKTNSTYVLGLLNLPHMDIKDVATWTYIFSNAVLYGYYSKPVSRLCRGIEFPLMINPNATSEELFSEHIQFIYSTFKGVSKNDPAQNYNISPWDWQVCTEFGFFQTGTKQFRTAYSSLIDLDYVKTGVCSPFGPDHMNPNHNAINEKYFGLDILDRTSRIVFVNGDMDPWHWLGINSKGNSTSDNIVISIEGAAHCTDMGGIGQQIKPAGIEAHNKILTAWDNYLEYSVS